MNQVLVTGGAGYIGSHTCKILLEHGWNPVTIDNLSTSIDDSAVKYGTFYQFNINEVSRVEKVLIEHDIKTVLHFAGSAYVGESIINPSKYYNNNFITTYHLLEAMRRANVKKIIFSSSCATYGISDNGYFSEKNIQLPINPYGRSKLYAENLINDYCRAYDFSATCLRYFNAAGADPSGELGERHEPETHLIPLTIFAALKIIKNLQVYGVDYSTPDGTCIRDYTHVSDLARAHVLAINFLDDNKGFSAFNLGTGQGASVFEIISGVEKIIGKSIPYNISPRRAGDPPVLVADIELANKVLGWYPEYGSINEIIETAVKYFSISKLKGDFNTKCNF